MPTHVGDCAVMAMTRHPDGSATIDQPWERFVVIDDDLLPLLVVDGAVRFDVASGWAVYRLVGQVPQTWLRRSVWELVDGEFVERQGEES